MKAFIWGIWGIVTVCLAGYYTYQFLWAEDKTPLLIGETTHGHHQIEMACSTCHTEAFGGNELIQEACVNCHGKDLDIADDSHPKSKFTDPRNADRAAILDATLCVTCHAEHDNENTLVMGLTIQQDYCFYCHEDIEKNRPSHKEMKFETCATSGCHNYHDNRALYEDFLIKHGKKPALLKDPIVPSLTSMSKKIDKELLSARELKPSDADAPSDKMDAIALADWHQSDHAKMGVNCTGCHQPQDQWIDQPSLTECQSCHSVEAEGFLSGKHGMRLSNQLENSIYSNMNAMTPRESKVLTFNDDSLDKKHGCTTCHSGHVFETKIAAVDACLACHNDKHSQSYKKSTHFSLWEKENTGDLPSGSGVSCATCHLPRETHVEDGKEIVRVQHNQNFNLKPNEKMIRSVCMNCHGLAFSIDALADPVLINNNFNGLPAQHIRSIDMAFDRLKETEN
ncbi:MAG: cytochrome c3 family protein [Cellvibrionaceae bacterium]